MAPKGFLAVAYEWSVRRSRLLSDPPGPQSLRAAIMEALREGRPALIIEYKRCSPSGFIAKPTPWEYVESTLPAADAYSVLVEPYWFCGSPELVAFFAGYRPVLAKDFTTSSAQLELYRRHGASAALLILDMLGWRGLDRLYEDAKSVGLEVLIETHDAESAIDVMSSYPASMVGINARNLETLEVSHQRLLAEIRRAAEHKPADVILVAESGIDSPGKALEASKAGADALLIGTWAMKDPGSVLKLRDHLKGSRAPRD